MNATPPRNPVFDFGALRDRRSTWSTKWNKYRGRDVLPFWVADMDFPTAPGILEALHARLDAGVLGYTEDPDSIVAAVCEWLAEHYAWHVHPDSLVFIPAVVGGFNAACRAIGAAGDQVLVPIPVYHPFLDAPRHFDREAVLVELTDNSGRWTMDFDRLRNATTKRTSAMLFCNPQNPTGRVYSRAELLVLAEFCITHNITLCSDEIHCPLVLDADAKHIPIASLNAEIERRTITLLAPTKAYNIPGVGCAVAVIPDPALREAFKNAKVGLVPSIGPLAYVASESAWRDRSGWLQALLEYLRDNRDFLAARMQQLDLTMSHVEGTYLAWIDVRGLKVENAGGWFENYGVGLSDGGQFGREGFVRFNFGCPRSLLEEGVRRFANAVAAARG